MGNRITEGYLRLLVVFIILAVYYPAIFSPFNSIDDMKMANGLLNMGEFSLKDLFFPHAYAQYYRPLVGLSFIVDKYLWGIEASFMHLENIVLHGLNALAVFVISRQILRDKGVDSPGAALSAALLFGLHPVNTEAVNWISARTDLLAGFFVFFSFILLLKSRFWSSSLYVVLGGVLFMAGCLAKETALFLLPGILIWCLIQPRDRHELIAGPSRFFNCLVLLAAAAAYLVMRGVALSGGDKIVSAAANISQNEPSLLFVDAVRIALNSLGFYVKKLFLPVPLNFGITSISPHYLWLGLIALVLMAYYVAYRRTVVSYLLFLACCAVSPALLLPLFKITWTPLAERYLYIASAPFIIALTVSSIDLFNKFHITNRQIQYGVVALLLVLTNITLQRNFVWQDNLTLFEDTVTKSPGFTAAKNELAVALRDKGRIDEANSIIRSNHVGEFQPSSLNRIRLLVEEGKLEEANALVRDRLSRPSDYQREIWELFVSVSDARRSRMIDEKSKNETDREIVGAFEKLIALTNDPFYYYRRGYVQLRLNDRVAARDSFQRAWRGAPPDAQYRAAALTLANRLEKE